MKAMVLRSPSNLALDQVARPEAPPGHVLVRITHSGLCGTDLKIYTGAIPTKYPLIMGHEMIGELVDGSPPPGIRRGDRVIIDPALSCGACFHCRIGQTNLCPAGGLIGRETNGGFAEYAAVSASQVFRLPDSIDSRTAPLIQAATTCLHAQQMTSLEGQSVAVMGLGVSGQLHVQLAKVRGASTIIGISRSAFKNDLAKQLGADLTIEAGPAAIEKVLDATDGLGPDVVIECTGVMTALADSIRMVRLGGRIILFGIMNEMEGALPFYDLYFKELTLISSRAAIAQDFPTMIDLVASGVVRLEPLVTHHMALRELGAALEMVEDGADRRLKIILDHT
jgi:2-desacetyl-2-hydroxyethyl bacteriochlorophyllide A dehydrogenase